MAVPPPSLSRRVLLWGLVACSVLQFAASRTRWLTPADSRVPAHAEGGFTAGGWYAGESFANAQNVRAWGSWSGADDNTGTLAIGPFRAPRVLRFALSGYLNHAGNSAFLELVGTSRRRPIQHAAVGERWEIVEVVLPGDWVGRDVRIVGRDNATGFRGWFAISEPIRGGREDGNNALLESFAAWSINALLLGCVFLASLRILAGRCPDLPVAWHALAAAACVAGCGYVAFWIYFLHALAGVIFSWALIAAAAFVAAYPARAAASGRARTAMDEAQIETATIARLMFAVGAFYLALLHLFPTAHDFYTLAANRFRESLPSDNQLSHELAERLFANQPIRHLGYEWLSSDRPPLQTGWELLTWPAGKMLGLDRRTLSGTSAVWFQLLWIPAVFGLLRSFGVGRRRTAGWIVALALSGFFLQNSVYTWPKLAAGAFTLGAFALLIRYSIRRGGIPPPGMQDSLEPNDGATASRPQHIAWAAAFAGLGWLAHGAVAFSFVAFLPWLVMCARRGPRRQWLIATAIFGVLVGPWFAYQKLYDPPANRLLKWHLGGQSQIDPRGAWETIRDAYAKIGWHEALENKARNFHGQVFGDWGYLLDVSAETQVDRRNQEFFQTGRGLTWWPVLALLGFVLTRRPRFAIVSDVAALTTWVLLTIGAWCLLMFAPYSAVIHQGSYAAMLGLFVIFSVVLERCGRRWLPILLALQAITLGTTWTVGNIAIHGVPAGLPLVVVSALALAGCVVLAPPCEPLEPSAAATADPTHIAPRWLRSLRDWWREPRLTWWLLVGAALLMFLRKPYTLLTPQLWAEDGSVFLNDQDEFGFSALFRPYMGYLHTLPRLIAWLAAHTFDPAWWPAFYNGVAFAIWLAVIARLFTDRFALPGKPWLALAFLIVPHTGEVLFNVTNLQWVTAFVLIQQAIIRPPEKAGERIGDVIILAAVSLTGPFVIAFLPLFAWRWWRDRRRDNLVALLVTTLCAAIQLAFVVCTGPKFPFQATVFQFWPAFEVLVRRVVLWPLAGHDVALSVPNWAVRTAGMLVLGGLAIWTLRRSPRRTLRAQILAAFVLIVLAGVYRTRPDTWAADNLDFGDRYFYIPRVLLGWLLIWEFNERPRLIGDVARLVCLAVVLMHITHYTLPAPKDHHWAEHVEPIRRGVPANIPILPEDWTLEYRGRPGGAAANNR